MKFNEKLPKLRTDKSLSQEQLADLLDVSRQAVSKWESGQTYPEMDKLIMMAKIFKCSLDDLTNDEVNAIDIISKKKNNIGNVVDELLDIIKRTTNMIRVMSVKEISKCIFTMMFVFAILLLFLIPFMYIEDLGWEIFSNFGVTGNILISLWRFILNVVYIILFILVFVYIFKTAYLDKYNNVQIIDTFEPEKSDEEVDVKKIKTKENIIKIKKEPSYKFFKVLGSLAMWFIKLIIFCAGVPFVICLLVLFAALIITIILMFKGVIYIGILLGIIFLIIFTLLITALIFYFLFNKKLEAKKIFVIFIISIIGLGIATGITTFEIANTNFIDKAPIKEKPTITKSEFDFEEKLLVMSYPGYEYVVDDNLTDKIVVEIEHYKKYVEPQTYIHSNTLYVQVDEYYNTFPRDLVNIIINDLSKKQIHNYDKLFYSFVKIYTSKENIKILEANEQKYYEEQQRFEEQINQYNEIINELQMQIEENQTSTYDKDEEIFRLKEEIEELKYQIQEYKDRIKDILN